MGSVYANSYLTIAASSSTDDEGGCFPSRVHHHHTYVSPDAQYSEVRDTRDEAVVTAKVRLSDGRTSNVYFFAEWHQTGGTGASSKVDPLLDEPLSSRAWTLQERILSPRTIHYGTNQLYFECGRGIKAEDGWTSFPVKNTVSQLIAGQNLGQPLGASRRLAADWSSLLRVYSERKLTRASDKLPPLSGLARMVNAADNDTYFAGVWISTLWRHLLWRVYPQEEPTPVGYYYREDVQAAHANSQLGRPAPTPSSSSPPPQKPASSKPSRTGDPS